MYCSKKISSDKIHDKLKNNKEININDLETISQSHLSNIIEQETSAQSHSNTITETNSENNEIPQKTKRNKIIANIKDIIKPTKSHIKVNPFFVEIQFHNDYRDTMNAFYMLLPTQKQLFNRSDSPITNITNPKGMEIETLIKNFIDEVNSIVKTKIADELSPNGWNNNYGEKEIKSGWDKQQEKLGIPGSIYTKPASKASIKLINIDQAEKYETEDEIRYVIFVVIQKKNVCDQMLVRISFQINKRDYNIDRDFFEKDNTYETSVRIEDIYVMGYMTKNSIGNKSIKEKYYNFDGITDGRTVTDKQIIKELNRKRKQYIMESVC
jgi:hypothetical protein